MYYSELVLGFRKRPFLRWVLCGGLVLWGLRVGMQYFLQYPSFVRFVPDRLLCLTSRPYSPWDRDTLVNLCFYREEAFVYAGNSWRANVRLLNFRRGARVCLYARSMPDALTKIGFAKVRLSPHGYSSLYLKGVMARAFLIGEIHVLERGELPPIERFRAACRLYWQSLFDRWQLRPDLRSVGMALLTGDKSGLDAEQYSRFRNAGAMHLLAVSGMHVGILYGLFSFLFRRITFGTSGMLKKNVGWQKLMLSLIVLFYAGMSGFSYSILRAAAVFMLPLWGNGIQRKADALNVLCFVALIQMIWEPAALFQPGFQLSYAAVASILIFEPSIKALFGRSRTSVHCMWTPMKQSFIAAFSVTLAANIGTLPLVAFHFGKIPVYFLLSGLLTAIPTTLLLSALVLAVPVTETIVPDRWVGYLLNKIFVLFDAPIRWISALPMPQWNMGGLNSPQLLSLILWSIALALWVYRTKLSLAVYCVLAGLILWML